MRRLQIEAFRWSSEAFGDADTYGPEKPLAHLKSEIDEILAAPNDHEEWADALLLLLSGMSRAGIDIVRVESYAWDKLDKNRKRKWGKPNAQGFSEHVEPPTGPEIERIVDKFDSIGTVGRDWLRREIRNLVGLER